MGVMPSYSKDDFIWVYRDVQQLVNIAEGKKLKSNFRKTLFSGGSAAGAKSRITIDDVDLMTGAEFEHFIARLFKAMGYEVSITQQSADQGIDVIALNDAMTLGVRAKCYSQAVGNSAVQEAVAGKAYYNCSKAMVITNSSFTPSAKQLAVANGVLLWGRDMLMKRLLEHPVVR